MKLQSLRHIFSGIALTALLAGSLMASGCAETHEVMEDVASPEVYNVEFRLKAGLPGYSRATEESGTVEECYIPADNLKILIFDEDKTLKQVLYDNGKMDAVTSFVHIGQGDYVLRTKLDPDKYNLLSRFAVVALANWSSADDDTKLITDWKGRMIDESEVGTLTIDDLASMTFTLNPVLPGGVAQPESWIPGNGHWIPMFGSRFTTLAGYNNAIFNEGNPMDLGTVDLVRAVSKIEVINRSTSSDSPVINSIVMSHHNQHGRLMQNYNFFGSTSQVAGVTIPSERGYTNTDFPFSQKGNVYTVYIPEMALPNADSRRAICVNYSKDGFDYQGWIYLADYLSDGTPNLTGPYDADWTDIKRNYIYRYTLSIDFNLEQSIGVVVAPYNSVVLEPEFGLDEK